MQAGAGMWVTIDGVEAALGVGDQPLRFSGDSHTTCRLLAGPVTDINIMSRRSVCSHVVTRIGANAAIAGQAQKLVLTTSPVSVGASYPTIGTSDLLVLEPGESLTIASGQALAIHFFYPGA